MRNIIRILTLILSFLAGVLVSGKYMLLTPVVILEIVNNLPEPISEITITWREGGITNITKINKLHGEVRLKKLIPGGGVGYSIEYKDVAGKIIPLPHLANYVHGGTYTAVIEK